MYILGGFGRFHSGSGVIEARVKNAKKVKGF